MSKGSLPKGNSGGSTIKLPMLQLSITILSLFFVATGIMVGIGLTGEWEATEENIATWNIALIFSVTTWIIGIPLMIMIILKYRKSELTNPTRLTKLYFRRRDAKQCTICQKHPASKKYHIKNEHNLKNVKIDDYFKDCGCDKCAIYNKSDMG